MRILIADDDPLTLQMLEHALQKLGYEVQRAADGEEAKQVLLSGACRLAIVDWEMPDVTGVDICRTVRDAHLPWYTYMVLLTGRASQTDTVEGLSAGADDFMVKPFNPRELAERLRAGERVLGLETRDVAIFAMAKIAESRDPETGTHLERVRSYTTVLARQLSTTDKFRDLVDPAFIRLIQATSPLHDIGKVAIPDFVLLKPGRLTDREFEIMKTHAREGARTLDAALHQYPHSEFLRMARDIALTHHERWDGTGYPEGLTGETIPLPGRIMALADVYDALVSKRVYKAAFTPDLARQTILDAAGTHFDPDLVEAFQGVETEFIDIQHRYRDEQPAAA